MIFQYNQLIPFTATDDSAQLTPGGCIDLFQDAANFHTQAVVDPAYLAKRHRVWILNYWHIFFDRLCHFNDKLRLSTWSSGTEGMFAHRNYTMETMDGTVCVRALSYWFLYDVLRQRPVRIQPEDIQWYEPSPALEWEAESRKIPLPTEGTPREPVRIWRYMIDGNGHVNNGWYVKIACEYVPVGKRVRELRVEYRTAAHLGHQFYPTVAETPDHITVALNNSAGKPYAIIAFSLAD